MKRIMARHFTIVSLATFALGSLGLILALHAYTSPKPKSITTQKPTHGVGYTLLTRRTFYPTNGDPVLRELTSTFHSATGAFRSVTTYFHQDGSVRTTSGFNLPDVGLFHLDRDGKKLVFLSSGSQPEEVTEDVLKRRKGFEREETIAGYHTLVFRSNDGETEFWVAPALGGDFLKIKEKKNNGVIVMEAVQVVLAEPDKSVVDVGVRLPVSFDFFERKIDAAKKQGSTAVAVELQQRLEAAKRQMSTQR